MGTWPPWPYCRMGIGGRLNTRIQQVGPTLVAVALAVVLVYRVLQVTTPLFGHAGVDGPASPSTATAVARKSAIPKVDPGAVAAMHLFGAAGQQAAGGSADDKLPETKLNLVLYGVYAEPTGGAGGAIIGSSGGTQRFYRVGEAIPGGATLDQVRAHEVVLRKAGRREVLRFPAGQDLSLTGSAGAPSNSRAVSYRELLRHNPMRITQYLVALPVPAQGGGLKGFRFFPGRDHGLYEELGLHPTDIVTRVNDIALTSPKQARRALDAVAAKGQLVADVIRDGRHMAVHVVLR